MYVSSDMQFPGPHASPPLDPLTRFGSAHAACSLYFTMGRETPKIAPSPGGIRVPLSGNNLVQVVHTHVPPSRSTVIWYRLEGGGALRPGR